MFCELVYQTIKENTPCLRTEHICLERSYGRVAVSDYYATKVVKEFDSSKVDGYAIQSADTLEATQLTGVEISIVNEVAAGDANHIPIAAYQGVRIMTGAPLPEGAKARNHVHACYFARLEESGQVTLSSKSNPLAEEEGILIMPKADAGEREAYYYAYGSWS